jgi:hypothetical protein
MSDAQFMVQGLLSSTSNNKVQMTLMENFIGNKENTLTINEL